MLKELITRTLTTLNEVYPTSYVDRLNHHYKYFKKKMGTRYGESTESMILERVIDKPVTLTFNKNLESNTIGNARKTENIIQFNVENLDGEIYTSGYKKEQPFQDKNVSTYDDYIKWVTVHEYCHLLYPELGHTNEFFKNIETIYKTI